MTPSTIAAKFPNQETNMIWIGALLTGWTNQTDATEKIWGTSGRGSASLVSVFKSFCDFKIMETRKTGRSIQYRATPELTEWAKNHPSYSSVLEAQ